MQGGGSSENVTSTTAPPAFQLPFIEQLMSEAQKRFEGPAPEFFPGSTVAGFDPATLNAQAGIINTAAPAAAGIVGQAGDTSNQILSGHFLDPNSDPNLQASLDAAARPINESLTEQTLPNIRSGAVQNRSIGGSRQGIAEGLASRGASNAIGDASANILSTNRIAGLDQMTKALALAPGTAAGQAIPSSLLDAVGTQRRQMDQANINEDIARHSFNETSRDQQLAQYASIVGQPFGSASSTNRPGVTGPSVGQGIFAGAATGAAMGGSVGGPYGAAIGAVVGAIGGGVMANNQ